MKDRTAKIEKWRRRLIEAGKMPEEAARLAPLFDENERRRKLQEYHQRRARGGR